MGETYSSSAITWVSQSQEIAGPALPITLACVSGRRTCRARGAVHHVDVSVEPVSLPWGDLEVVNQVSNYRFGERACRPLLPGPRKGIQNI